MRDTGSLVDDLLDSLAAIGRSMQDTLDPERFLADFSAHLQRLVPHDRLVVDHLDEGGRTFTVLAEHVIRGPRLHEAHYTTGFGRGAHYVVDEWAMRPVFAGTAMTVGDFGRDPRFARAAAPERRVHEGGIRSGLLVPLAAGGRVIGALVATSLEPDAYDEDHAAAGRRVADLIAPFIDNVVLLARERRRRERLRALEPLPRILAASLDVGDVFGRLAEAVRPLLDFDVTGVCLISASGRELEMLAEVDDRPTVPTPPRIPLDHFSFAARVEAGEVVMIRDAPAELDPSRPGDRLVLDGQGRACLSVPLWFGETVGGALYFGKRRPHWFDEADVEIATAIAAQVVLAVQHQRLAAEQRRLASAEVRARRLEERVESLREALGERYGFDRIIGRAPALREALARAAKAAPTETTVLITGESGTGKELVARAIHGASLRADGPFVAVSCAALPETLLESELFGHERGAFTGADRVRRGRFELAAGGTLFLDEVGELSPGVQVKLLRVLQERAFERVGGAATLRADVRIIAATNRDLARAVETGRFREDLYYRLDVFPVPLPPLRERNEDILLLAEHFVRELGARMGQAGAGLSREARAALLAHPWPGNIRELQNAVERALILAEGGLITAGPLGLEARRGRPAAAADGGPGARDGAPSGDRSGAVPAPAAAGRSLADLERTAIADALRTAGGNKSTAARALGLTRSQLYTRLSRLGLRA
jgi:two-component system response regulator HydG